MKNRKTIVSSFIRPTRRASSPYRCTTPTISTAWPARAYSFTSAPP